MQTGGRVQITVLGETFTVKGAGSAQEVELVGDFLAGEIDAVKQRLPSVSPKSLAILTAYSLAEELLRLRKDYGEILSILNLDKTES